MSDTTSRSIAGNEVWWNIRQVAEFLGVKPATARHWMWKNNVRRSKANYRLTHKSWVEAALNARAKKFPVGQEMSHWRNYPRWMILHKTQTKEPNTMNQSILKTVNIRGKEYTLVESRIAFFNQNNPVDQSGLRSSGNRRNGFLSGLR